MKAKKIYYYWRIYQQFLIENNLPDDSEDISAEDLINYVENQINDEDRARLEYFVNEAY